MKTLFGIFILAVTILLTSCATLFAPASGAMFKIVGDDRTMQEKLQSASGEYALQVSKDDLVCIN